MKAARRETEVVIEKVEKKTIHHFAESFRFKL